jgi:hypothetical protein
MMYVVSVVCAQVYHITQTLLYMFIIMCTPFLLSGIEHYMYRYCGYYFKIFFIYFTRVIINYYSYSTVPVRTPGVLVSIIG